MPVTVLVGAQWGDEGKGKVADWLADDAQIIARFNGGNNAGHTLNVKGSTYKLHFIPSGILRAGVVSLMGGGMVIHPRALLEEMDTLREQGVDITPERLKLATNAHIITPGHQALERAQEAARGADKIGTTGRGIGPAYASKVARDGLQAAEMTNPDAFAEQVRAHIETTNHWLARVYEADSLDADAIAQDYKAAAEALAPYIVSLVPFMNDALSRGARILAEGGQGTLLDIDHGNYPFVTSSNATSGGAMVGLGIGPSAVDRVVGVAKAYCTRVGSGPFPTEQDNETGARLRGDGSKPWDDYGTTTGRPRRTGWLDLVALRYAAQVNGLTELAFIKLDILSRFDQIDVAVAYDLDGTRLTSMPPRAADFPRVTPVYETLPGWGDDIMATQRYDDLPQQAREYVEWVEAQLGLPIRLVSVGPGREQTFVRA